MKTYRGLSATDIQNLSFIQTGDRFNRHGYTYEIGERIEGDTYHLTNLSTGKTGRCLLNQLIEKIKRGVYNSFNRVIVTNLDYDDLIYDTLQIRHYTILSSSLSNYNEVLIRLKDHKTNGFILWTETYILEQINKDRFRLISNTTNNNEKITVIDTDVNRERSTTAISSSTTRQIASTSRLVGNGKTGAIKATRVGGFKISQNAISN